MFNTKHFSSIGKDVQDQIRGFLDEGSSSTSVSVLAASKPAKVDASGYRPFDSVIGEIELPASFCVVGVSSCGKTVLVTSLLRRLRSKFGSPKFSAVYDFSGFKGLNNDYVGEVPSDERFFNLDLKKIKRTISGQEALIKRGVKKQICIIVDDFIGKFNMHQSKTFDSMATSARHRGISMIYLSQKINKLSPVIREACLYWFVIKTNLPSLEVLYQNQTQYEKKNDFVNACKTMTSACQYSSVFINNQNPYGQNVSFLLPAIL